MEYFDTLTTYDRLRETSLDDFTCRRLSEVIRDSSAARFELLATKEDLKYGLAELRAELKGDIANLKGDIANSKNELLRWIIGLFIAQISLTLGLTKFF